MQGMTRFVHELLFIMPLQSRCFVNNGIHQTVSRPPTYWSGHWQFNILWSFKAKLRNGNGYDLCQVLKIKPLSTSFINIITTCPHRTLVISCSRLVSWLMNSPVFSHCTIVTENAFIWKSESANIFSLC